MNPREVKDGERPFSLKEKVAIITGGNGGIGRRIAEGLAAAGSDVVVVARNQEKIKEAVQGIQRQFKRRVLGLRFDYTGAKGHSCPCFTATLSPLPGRRLLKT